MIASEKSGRGAERYRGRSAFLDQHVEAAMGRLLELGSVEAHSRFVTVDGVRLHYLECGAGDPIVLLHGAGGGAANWYRLMAPLAQRFRVISIDLPCFGLSDALEPKRNIGRQTAELMAGLLDEIQVRPVHIAGTSFGGLVAARLAQILHPRTLTLIDAAGMWPEASLGLRLVCNRLIQRIPLKQTAAGVRWLFRNVLISKRLPAADEDALVDYIHASAERADRRALARGYALFAGLRGQLEVLSHKELSDAADQTLIIWGERDRFLPAPESRRAAALAAGLRLRIIPGVGHSPNWEAPAEVLDEMIGFINGNQKEKLAGSA